jgi:hypothetical protein
MLLLLSEARSRPLVDESGVNTRNIENPLVGLFSDCVTNLPGHRSVLSQPLPEPIVSRGVVLLQVLFEFVCGFATVQCWP